MFNNPPYILTLTLALIASGCSPDQGIDQEQAAPITNETTPATWQFIELAPDHPVITTGQQVAGQLISTLLARVTSEMQAKGPIGAIEVCRSEAMELTESVAREHRNVRRVKRTSDRLRNPHNRPDAAEQLALDHFRQLLLQPESPPGPFVQVGSAADGLIEHRFYQPIFLAGACLRCHGQPDSIQPEVLGAIDKLYPEDEATGYTEGDWRGLIRISFIPQDE